MGGGVSKTLGLQKGEIMNVDPVLEIDKRNHTFSRAMFKKMEWEVLKAFCQKYKIKQTHLIVVFQRYLTHDEVYIREFKVRTKDPKMLYLRESRLQQELAEILIPSIYMKSFTGLERMETTEEVSFARFAVMSFIFGLQQFPDLLYDFFSIVRRKMDLSISVVFSSYSIQQICLLMVEDLKISGGSLLIKRALQTLDQAPDLRLKTLLRIGTKYPLLFWALQKFRRCYQRFVFGDKFWPGRKSLKLKTIEMLDFPSDFNVWFHNEVSAIKFTAIHIISDIMISSAKEWSFTDIYHPPLAIITYEQITRLKEVVGYKIATKLLIESEIPFDFNPLFAAPFIQYEPENDTKACKEPACEVQPESYQLDGEHSEVNAADNRQDFEVEAADDIDDCEMNAVAEDMESDDRPQHDDYPEMFCEDDDHDEVVGVIIHDDAFNREFAYDVQSGRSRWAKIIMDEAGRTLVYTFD